MQVFWNLASIILMIVLLIGIAGSQAVHAQADTLVRVVPADTNVMLNGSNIASLQLMVEDAYDLNGFEIRITYDPDVVILSSWTHGGILQNLLRVIGDKNEPGLLQLVYVQRATPGFNGDGVLLNLNFSGVAWGSSPITIEAVTFVTGQDPVQEYHPAVQNGLLDAVYDPNLLPQYGVVGSVALQGQTLHGGVEFLLGTGLTYHFGPYSSTSLDVLGSNLDFGTVIGDSYLLTTNQERYLNIHAGLGKYFSVSETNTSMELLKLYSGNAVWTDNVINAADASLVGTWYGKSTADLEEGEVLNADVNFDGKVDLRDLAIVAGNYGLSAEVAYASWEP